MKALFGIATALADARNIDSDMDSNPATVSESSESTRYGDRVEPPPPYEDFGDGEMHPCMQCKAMTLTEWGVVLGSLCTKECHDIWHANIAARQAAAKLKYENRQPELIIHIPESG